jgi:hypothetical protein
MQSLKTNFDTTATTYTSWPFSAGYPDTSSVNRVVHSLQQTDSIVAIKALESLMNFALKDSEMITRLSIPAHLIVSDYTATNEDPSGELQKQAAAFG